MHTSGTSAHGTHAELLDLLCSGPVIAAAFFLRGHGCKVKSGRGEGV
jgi:hypothetical protein